MTNAGNTMTLPDLISLLESATEGSRELDWRVAEVIGHPSMIAARPDFFPPFMPQSKSDREIAHFTTSLDAALTLVPTGWKKSLSDEANASYAKHAAHAYIMERSWPEPSCDRVAGGHASTLPLALTIACLKARAAG